jgi:hypothetical protein
MFYYNELGEKIKRCLWNLQGFLKFRAEIGIENKKTE